MFLPEDRHHWTSNLEMIPTDHRSHFVLPVTPRLPDLLPTDHVVIQTVASSLPAMSRFPDIFPTNCDSFQTASKKFVLEIQQITHFTYLN
jgi:hypothetical protein